MTARMHFYDNLAARRGACGAESGDDDRHFYGNPGHEATVQRYAFEFDRCLDCLKAVWASRSAPRQGGDRG